MMQPEVYGSDFVASIESLARRIAIFKAKELGFYQVAKSMKTWSDEEWAEYHALQDKARAKREAEEAAEKEAHARMWLEVYSPGTEYDPEQHWLEDDWRYWNSTF